MEDGQIILLYLQRDESAVAQTELKYGRYLSKIAYHILHDLEDSRECVNDAYLCAWNSIPPHEPQVLSTYLGKITRQLAIDLFRKKNRMKRGGTELALSLSELADCIPDHNSVETEVETLQLANTISSYLRTLPPLTRQVFVSRYFYLDSIREIATRFEKSESGIKSMLYRTRLGLKSYLEKEELL